MSKRAPAEQLITGYSFINASIFVLTALFIAGGFFYTKTFKTPLKLFYTTRYVSPHPTFPSATQCIPWTSVVNHSSNTSFPPHQAIQKEMVITHVVELRFTTT